MSSKPLNLPGKHLINSSLLGANALTMAGFLTMSSSTPLLAGSYLGASTALSFIKGYTTTAAIGGADMRQSHDILSTEPKLTHQFSGRYYRIKCLLVRSTISQ